MKIEYIIEPNGIPIEIQKYLADERVTQLTNLFNKTLKIKKMPHK